MPNVKYSRALTYPDPLGHLDGLLWETFTFYNLSNLSNMIFNIVLSATNFVMININDDPSKEEVIVAYVKVFFDVIVSGKTNIPEKCYKIRDYIWVGPGLTLNQSA